MYSLIAFGESQLPGKAATTRGLPPIQVAGFDLSKANVDGAGGGAGLVAGGTCCPGTAGFGVGVGSVTCAEIGTPDADASMFELADRCALQLFQFRAQLLNHFDTLGQRHRQAVMRVNWWLGVFVVGSSPCLGIGSSDAHRIVFQEEGLDS